MYTVTNKDTGSLKVGDIGLKVGDTLHIVGDPSPKAQPEGRKVTSLMGEGDRTCAVCSGTGSFPLGKISFTVNGIGSPDSKPSRAQVLREGNAALRREIEARAAAAAEEEEVARLEAERDALVKERDALEAEVKGEGGEKAILKALANLSSKEVKA